MHSVLGERKQRHKRYIVFGKTDLFNKSMGLCGNFTRKILQLHAHVISPLPFLTRDENTCFDWNPKSNRLVFLRASALPDGSSDHRCLMVCKIYFI